MINFAVKPVPKVTQEDKIRKMVLGITTAVLVVYLIAVAGLWGWRWYWSDKEESDQSQLQELAEQIVAKSTTEVLIRKLASRSSTTTDYLNNRPNVYLAATNLENERIVIKKWHLFEGANQSADLAASSTAELNDFTKQLAGKYSNVQISQSRWTAVDGWVNTVMLGGIGR